MLSIHVFTNYNIYAVIYKLNTVMFMYKVVQLHKPCEVG